MIVARPRQLPTYLIATTERHLGASDVDAKESA